MGRFEEPEPPLEEPEPLSGTQDGSLEEPESLCPWLQMPKGLRTGSRPKGLKGGLSLLMTEESAMPLGANCRAPLTSGADAWNATVWGRAHSLSEESHITNVLALGALPKAGGHAMWLRLGDRRMACVDDASVLLRQSAPKIRHDLSLGRNAGQHIEHHQRQWQFAAQQAALSEECGREQPRNTTLKDLHATARKTSHFDALLGHRKLV